MTPTSSPEGPEAGHNQLRDRRRKNQRGVILLLACFCMPLLIGLLGLGVDLSAMYTVKARLQMACDGAAVAAIRSMSLGQDTSAQQAAATAIAAQWFTANFNGNFFGIFDTTSPAISLTTDQNGSRSVTVTASTKVPTYFMRYVGRDFTPLTASATTTRKDIVMMLVLDRSGSMNNVNNSYGGLTPCDVMKASAKQFLGTFTPGRDRIGLVTFAETGMVVSAPVTTFQSVLGYSNGSGSANGAIDNISCNSWTNTSTALALAYNELYKAALPGAQNVIVLFTDGQPTAGTFDFQTDASIDPTHLNQTALAASSGCDDGNPQPGFPNGKPINQGGDMARYPHNWLGSQSNGGGVISLGSNSYPGFSPLSGPIGAVATNGTTLSGVDAFFSPGTSPNEFQLSATDAPGCSFTGDIAYIPPVDVWGNATTGYRTALTTTYLNGANRIAVNAPNLANVVFNTADNMANTIRTLGVQINAIGLGGNGGVDYELLQRVTNDPHGDTTVPYPPNAAFNPNQPVGTFIYSPTSAQISASFATLGSVLMRMSR
jgi:Flp pilus assembly protein TadG